MENGSSPSVFDSGCSANVIFTNTGGWEIINISYKCGRESMAFVELAGVMDLEPVYKKRDELLCVGCGFSNRCKTSKPVESDPDVIDMGLLFTLLDHRYPGFD